MRATVTPVGRLAVVLRAVCALVLGGLASALLLAATKPPTSPATTTAPTATTTVSTASSVIAFSGHGWGHGLGLSQWGAYGYAQHGWTFEQILAHYYTGTTLGTTKVGTVRVLLASEKKPVLASTVPWTVTDSAGTKQQLDPGTLPLTTQLVPSLRPPLTFAAAQPLSVDGRAYRGRLVVNVDGKVVDVVNVVGVDSYVKGVVPSEMPANWSTEAVKAQAVAARSYALANVAKARSFDLYGDGRSQVYGGVAAETPATNADVDATKGQIVMYAGKVADTLFSSTSGGRTASAFESTGIAVPYLVAVADPYDTLSPYHDWGPVIFDAAKVAKQLKLSAPIADLSAVNGPSGRVKTVAITSLDDTSTTFTGNQVRAALDLRSNWFTPALLQLTASAKSMTYGGAVSLTGLVQGAQGVSLEAKTAATDWAPLGALIVDPSGGFATVVKPSVTTSYRLPRGTIRAGLAKVSVAARVTATLSATGITGTERPVASGAPVELQQQQADATWTTVSSATADASGAFAFAGQPAAGTYRVRVTPGNGLVAGLSAAFTA